MTIKEAIREYRLPNPTTPEDLETRWPKILQYGDKILMAGYKYNGAGCPSYYAAIYEFLTDDTTCEGMIGLQAASELQFEDEGHAIEWALSHT